MKKYFKWANSIIRLSILKIRYKNRIIFDYSENKKPVFIGKRCSICIDKNALLVIGGGTYISDDCQIAIMESATACLGSDIYIGKGSRIFIRDGFKCADSVLLADNVSIYDHNHQYRNLEKEIMYQGFTSKKIEIGNGSWLSTNVVVCQGTIIGEHVVIGANAVVQGKLEDKTVYVSNKACKIKEIG